MNPIQSIIERSVYQSINSVLVLWGYALDPNDPKYSDLLTAQSLWDADLQTIITSKGFALEIFGAGKKPGLKRVPRIVIRGLKINVGDLANDRYSPAAETDPLDPTKFRRVIPPFDTCDISLEIHLAYQTAEQSRILHSAIATAIGTRAYLPFYNDFTQRFYIQQTGFSDIPDSLDDLQEKVYSYETKDLYVSDDVYLTGISPITQITLTTTISDNLSEDNIIVANILGD